MNKTTITEIIGKMKTGKIYGLFHNDLDGYGCGKVAASFVNLANAEYLPYSKVNSAIDEYCNNTHKDYDGLIVADLNLDMTRMEKLNKLAKTGHCVMYFDHHYKTIEQFEFFKKSKIFFDYDKDYCATSILLKHFVDNGYTTEINVEKLTEIVNLIDGWDMYKWQDPETFEVLNEEARDLNIYFKEFGYEKTLLKIDNYITEKFKNLFSNIEISNIMLLKRNIRRAVADRNKNLAIIQYPYEGEVLDIGITYAERDISEIGNMLNILNKHLSFIVVIDMVHNSVNFRTIFNKPNLANIAAQYGGGGHPKAAGCELNEKAFNAFVNKNLSREQVDMLIAFNMNKNKEESNETTETEAVEVEETEE